LTKWTVKTPEGIHVERNIITGMIVSDQILRNMGLTLQLRWLKLPYAQTVAKWCLDYFQIYDQAPGAHIQDIFEAHRRNGMEPDQAALIAQFLGSISDAYEQLEHFNERYLLDEAEKYFLERSLEVLREDIDLYLQSGNLLAAQEAVALYSKPSGSTAIGCEPLRDRELFREAFSSVDELFRLPGDLGTLIGPFERETTWGLVGAYKAGKTWLCQYIALQALYRKLNVAWFSLEMPKVKTIRRLGQGICGMPDKPPRDGGVWVRPVWDCKKNQQGACRLPERVGAVSLGEEKPLDYRQAPPGYVPCAVCRGTREYRTETWLEPFETDIMTWGDAWARAESMSKMLYSRFKFKFWPKYSAGISEIKSTLRIWEHMEGFLPHLIILDSVDILKRKGGDQRHAINENREKFTALSQEFHACGITPIQKGSKEAVERATGRRTDVAEDSRILGHVDGMLVVNQTDREREWHRARVSVSLSRHDISTLAQEVIILQQLDLGQGVLDSCFKR